MFTLNIEDARSAAGVAGAEEAWTQGKFTKHMRQLMGYVPCIQLYL